MDQVVRKLQYWFLMASLYVWLAYKWITFKIGANDE